MGVIFRQNFIIFYDTAWGSYHFKGTPKDDKPLVLVFRYQKENGETLSVVWNLAKKQAHFMSCFVRVQKSESRLTCYGQLFCELDEKTVMSFIGFLKDGHWIENLCKSGGEFRWAKMVLNRICVPLTVAKTVVWGTLLGFGCR